VGSGKTALLLALCKALRDNTSLAVVTNDIFTREDAEFLQRNDALPAERIQAVETGGCPHTAIREDVLPNLVALEGLHQKFAPHLMLCESGGDNLAAHFSRELADFTVYVIDVAGGDKVPFINKTDLSEAVGADLAVMDRDAGKMRGDGPYILGSVKNNDGVAQVVDQILAAPDATATPA